MQTVVKEYTGKELINQIIKPLDNVLTGVNKYCTLPIYIIHCLVSKINNNVLFVGTTFDDRELMAEVTNFELSMEAAIMDGTPSTVYPTIMVYPNDLPRSSVVYDKNEMYIYSSSYLINGKTIKPFLKKEGFIKKVSVIRYSEQFVNVEFDFDESILENLSIREVIAPLPKGMDVVKLPLISYAKSHNTYTSLFNKIRKNDGIVITDSSYLEFLFSSIKEEQSLIIEGTDAVVLYKDFIKQKPTAMVVYSDRTKYNEDTNIMNVCLEMSYSGSKLTHLLFYRYIENIVTKIIGNYDEL